MIGALWTGISGLAGQQVALDNESNNIANVNTIGFKASRISFADQMYQNKIGKGTAILDAEKLYTQGNLKVTGVAFDMALAGNGFFSVASTGGAGMAETYYSRAGNFRMGDNGTLQDAAGNAVQGWSMTKLSDVDIVSTDQNVKRFTSDFVKPGASYIIRNANTIESITAKMTDYTTTAKADSLDIFSGAGMKSKSAKQSDVEALTTAYTKALIDYKNDPTGLSISPGVYKNTLDFVTAMPNLIEGSSISVFIDGAKKTQKFVDSPAQTLKLFADQISSVKGMSSWVTDNANNNPATATGFPKTPGNPDGFVRIESLIPGKIFTVSQMLITTKGGSATPGTVMDSSVKVDPGSGYSAVSEIRDALKKAVTGKQQDVYTASDELTGNPTTKDLSYQLTIYDPQSNANISVPTAGPITFAAGQTIAQIVAAINDVSGGATTSGDAGELGYYVEALEINGALVIQTLNKNYDLEISGDMKDVDDATNIINVPKNPIHSGRAGAGAEFLEITSVIEQTGSKGAIQLKLDGLGISNSPFGDFAIDGTGLITMKQDGGTFAVGQIAIALFNDNRGLLPVGDNLLRATDTSGTPIYNLNNNKTATVKGATLELSTADLSSSLVNLMVFQRAFEANAKSITTADAILNTLINLKR